MKLTVLLYIDDAVTPKLKDGNMQTTDASVEKHGMLTYTSYTFMVYKISCNLQIVIFL